MGLIDRIKKNIEEASELKRIEEEAYRDSHRDHFQKRVEIAKEHGRQRGSGELAHKHHEERDASMQKIKESITNIGKNVGEFCKEQTQHENGYDPFEVVATAKDAQHNINIDPLGVIPKSKK